MPCPRCASDQTYRSARRGIERILSWFFVWPFRCDQCDARFYRVVWPSLRLRA